MDDLVAYLKTRTPAVAKEAAADLMALARLLGRRPGIGRPGERSGSREFSVRRWYKVVVYRVHEDGVEISTLRDTRRGPPD